MVTYDTSKTKAVLFSKVCRQKLAKLLEIRLKIDERTVYFKNEGSPWFGILLDSQQKFGFHINERSKKGKAAKAQIKRLNKMYRLYL